MGFFGRGGWSGVGTTGLSKKESLLDAAIRKRGGLENVLRVKQGNIDYLNQYDSTRVTFDDLEGKGTDSDSGFFTTSDGTSFGGRAPTIQDSPEHGAYAKESSVRYSQKAHYAQLWGVPVEAVTDEHIYAMGRKADVKFKKLATEGQGTYNSEMGVMERSTDGMEAQWYFPEADARYNPEDTKLEGTTRDRISLYNPETGTNLYHAMNTPEFNTKWFEDSPEQNKIRAAYESEHGAYYETFRAPFLHSNVYETGDGTYGVYSSDGQIHEKNLNENDLLKWQRNIEKQPNPLIADNWSTDRLSQEVKKGYVGLKSNLSRAIDPIPHTLDGVPKYTEDQFEAYRITQNNPQISDLISKTPELQEVIANAEKAIISQEEIDDYKQYSLDPTLAPKGYKESTSFKRVNDWNVKVLDRNIRDLISIMKYEEEASKLDTRRQKVNAQTSREIADNPYEDGGMLNSILYDIANRKKEFLETIISSTPHMAVAMTPYVGIPVLAVLKQDDMAMAYAEKYGTSPSQEQIAWMWGTALIASRLEKMGAEVIVGKSKFLNRVFDAIYNKAAAKSTLLAKAISIPSRIGISGIVESGSEMGTQAFEQMGATDVRTDGIDIGSAFDLKEAGMAGLIGGGSLTAPQAVISEALNTKMKRLGKIEKKLDIPETIEVDNTDTDIGELQLEYKTVRTRADEISEMDIEGRKANREEYFGSLKRLKELRKLIQAKKVKSNTVPNPDALSPKHREELQKAADNLRVDLKDKLDTRNEKKQRKTITKVNKQIEAINKQLFRLEEGEQTDQVVKEIQEKYAQLAVLYESIQDKAGVGAPVIKGDSLKVLKEVSAKLENSSDLSIEEIQSLLNQYATATNDVMQRSTADPTNAELLDAQQESWKNLNKYEALLSERVDLTEAKEKVAANAEKDTFVYSLGFTDADSSTALNDILAKGTLSPIETEIVEAKQEVVGIKQEILKGAKTVEDVNKDITEEGSSDFVSFNTWLDLVKKGDNLKGHKSGLEQFAKHMQGKADTLRKAYDTFLKTNKAAVVEYRGTEYTIDNSTATLLNYVEREAAYGQKILALAKKVAAAKVDRKVDPKVTEAKRQLSLNEQLLTKISKIGETVRGKDGTPPKPTERVNLNAKLDTASSATKQTKSVEGASKDAKITPRSYKGTAKKISKLTKRALAIVAKSEELDTKLEENTLFPNPEYVNSLMEVAATLRNELSEMQDTFRGIASGFNLDIKDGDIIDEAHKGILYTLLDGAIALGVPEIENKIRAINSDYAKYDYDEDAGTADKVNVTALKRLAELQKNNKEKQTKPKVKAVETKASKIDSAKISELENEIEILEDIKPNTIKAENLLNKQIQEKKDQLKLLNPSIKTKQESIIPDISTVQLLESGAAYEQGGVAKVYAVGHYSKSQWIEISKKLGVLPDVC